MLRERINRSQNTSQYLTKYSLDSKYLMSFLSKLHFKFKKEDASKLRESFIQNSRKDGTIKLSTLLQKIDKKP